MSGQPTTPEQTLQEKIRELLGPPAKWMRYMDHLADAAADELDAAAAREAELREKLQLSGDAMEKLRDDHEALSDDHESLLATFQEQKCPGCGRHRPYCDCEAELRAEVERLRAENAELSKRPADLSDEAIGAACAFDFARRMDKAEAAKAAKEEA